MVSVFADKGTQTGETTLVGTHILKFDADRLAMLSLEKGTSKAAILKGLIEEYLRDRPTLPSMIKLAVNRAVKHWKEVIAPNTRSAGFEKARTDYLKEMKKDLKSKRIEPNLITTILKQIREKIYEA